MIMFSYEKFVLFSFKNIAPFPVIKTKNYIEHPILTVLICCDIDFRRLGTISFNGKREDPYLVESKLLQIIDVLKPVPW